MPLYARAASRGSCFAQSPVPNPQSLVPICEPRRRLRQESRWHTMAAVELVVLHIVSGVLEPRHELAARLIDRQDRVAGAVRDEDLRLAVERAVDDEARRERRDA